MTPEGFDKIISLAGDEFTAPRWLESIVDYRADIPGTVPTAEDNAYLDAQRATLRKKLAEEDFKRALLVRARAKKAEATKARKRELEKARQELEAADELRRLNHRRLLYDEQHVRGLPPPSYEPIDATVVQERFERACLHLQHETDRRLTYRKSFSNIRFVDVTDLYQSLAGTGGGNHMRPRNRESGPRLILRWSGTRLPELQTLAGPRATLK